VASETLTWTDEVFRIRDLEPGRTPGLAEALSYYAPGSRPLIEAAIDSALREGSAWDLELEMITATGRSIWVHSQGRAERVHGKTVRLDGAFQEITEQRRVKLQLEEYQQHLSNGAPPTWPAAGSGKGRRPGQGFLPGQRQPRIADAAQRGHRALGAGPATAAPNHASASTWRRSATPARPCWRSSTTCSI
jgi:hypothetical protein